MSPVTVFGGTPKTRPVFDKKGRFKFWEWLMQDSNNLREQARKCRTLANTAIEPKLIEQLREWSIELANEADRVERRAAEVEGTIIST
jgi:hypothetical protein